MPHLTNVFFAYPGSPEPLLENITVAFPNGWTAVTGDNGCGKTTLASIAIGLITPDSGTVTPTGLVCALCPQSVGTEPRGLEEFAADYSSDAIRIRERTHRLAGRGRAQGGPGSNDIGQTL